MTSIKNLLKSLVFSCLFFMASAAFAGNVSAAAKLYFDPATATPTQNSDINVTVKIDTGGTSAFGADAIISYPSSDLTVKSIVSGSFFSDFTSAQSTGRIEIHSYMSAQFATNTGIGNLAVITFNTNKGSGNGAVSFVCTADATNSEILDSNGNNILSCNDVNQLNLTYTGSTTTGDNNSPYPPGYSTPNSCGGTCGSNYNCAAPLYCYNNSFCRNTDCPTDLTCGCKATPTPAPTKKPAAKTTPKPTAEVIALAPYTPPPASTPLVFESPLPTPAPEQKAGINIKTLGILIGSSVLALAIIFMIISRNRNKPPKMVDLNQTQPPAPPPNFPV